MKKPKLSDLSPTVMKKIENGLKEIGLNWRFVPNEAIKSTKALKIFTSVQRRSMDKKITKHPRQVLLGGGEIFVILKLPMDTIIFTDGAACFKNCIKFSRSRKFDTIF
ncbi:MAG: hypothetical protein HY507_01960 [Candidatus Zambryskibacteria bacterium]|nr:hypothetical protein [Candidatus Zambryskibacteria bacterium]